MSTLQNSRGIMSIYTKTSRGFLCGGILSVSLSKKKGKHSVCDFFSFRLV